MSDLQNAPYFIAISESKGENGGNQSSVSWNPYNTSGGPDENGNTFREAFIGLAHELGHAHDFLDGFTNQTQMSGAPTGIRNWEYNAMHWENKIRSENNIPLRTGYTKTFGRAIEKNTRTSTVPFLQITIPTIELRQNSNGIQSIGTAA